MQITRLSAIALAAAGILATSAAAHAATDGPPDRDAATRLVTAEMARSKAPGIAVAIVQGGRIVRVSGFGQANVEHAVPVHADTLFKTGATGMPFTAIAIGLLAQDGRIALDAPVSRYLPAAPAKWKGVTIRHLLDHTSGLPATPNGDFRADYTPAELLAIIAAQDVNYAPGTRFRFGYANYIVLGMVIEQVTGEPWSAFLAKRLFAPLGMATARGIDERSIIPNRASGYEVRDGAIGNAEWISQSANSTADGSLYLSALDFAAWAQSLASGAPLDRKMAEVLQKPGRLNDGAACAAVPGWLAQGEGKGRYLWQAGSWQGFAAHLLRYPERDLTVAVLANGDSADVRMLAHRLAALADATTAGAAPQPLIDADARLTARARELVSALAEGKARAEDFTDFAQLDFTELAAYQGGIVGALGRIESFALYERLQTCGETRYRYRAQMRDGTLEVRLGLAANGKVASLDIVPIADLAQPL